MLVGTGCGAEDGSEAAPRTREITLGPGAADQAVLTGAGSTFVEPLLRQWIERYQTVAPGVTVNYQPVGSSAGMARLESGDGDFFTSDTPLSELEEVTLGGSEAVMLVPWAAGAIAVAYNLPDVGAVRLAPQTLSAIFAGRVLRWDEPAIRADNPDLRLPNLPIQVVYRSDASGTTEVFTSYLEAASGSWALGSAPTVRFPRGVGAGGSSGVAAAIQRTAGAVGYVQLGYARQASLGVALLGNRAGNYVEPTPAAVNAALAGANNRRHGTAVDLLFTPDSPGAYPLATLSYVLFRREGLDPVKAAALRHFASWALSEGQRLAEPLGYTPVPRQFQMPALYNLQKL